MSLAAAPMDEEIRQKILTLLDQHRIMTIATPRPDGWPQATTVGYVNDGLTPYFLCGLQSQKAANLAVVMSWVGANVLSRRTVAISIAAGGVDGKTARPASVNAVNSWRGRIQLLRGPLEESQYRSTAGAHRNFSIHGTAMSDDNRPMSVSEKP